MTDSFDSGVSGHKGEVYYGQMVSASDVASFRKDICHPSAEVALFAARIHFTKIRSHFSTVSPEHISEHSTTLLIFFRAMNNCSKFSYVVFTLMRICFPKK